MMIWKPIDEVGYWIHQKWTPELQIRTGTLMTIVGVVLVPIGPFTGEPLLVYEMSAAALIVGGLGVLITAMLAVKQDPNVSEEDLKP